jgi:hypothetical protein
MNAGYDTSEWATETTLGRRIFNVNFRLDGRELRGWEIIKSVAVEQEAGVTERVYIWRKSGARRETLIRVGVVEHDSWSAAQQGLYVTLLHCMRPDIPRGEGALAQTGDVSFAASDVKTKRAASVFFCRGNVVVSVASVGEAMVDVAAFAKKLDAALRTPPRDTELKSRLAEQRSPRSFEVKRHQPVTIIENLPQVLAAGGWIKVIAPDGELRREDDHLVYVSEQAGRKRVGQYLYSGTR